VRTIELPPLSMEPNEAVTRQGTSFVLRPWKSGEQGSLLHTYTVDERGRNPRFFEVSGSTNDVSWPAFLSEAGVALEVFVTRVEGGGEDSFESRAWANLDGPPEARGNILRAPWRGTNDVALVPSLDGKRALFALWPVGLSDPTVAVIGSDGARVGEAITLSVPTTSALCTAVVPTARGGFVSFVDSNHELRLVELGQDGELVRQASWPLPSAGYGCPVFTLEPTGVAFLLDRAEADEPPDKGLYRLDAHGSVTEVPVTLPGEAMEVAMLGDDPLVLHWSPQGAELSRPARGELWPITLPPGYPRRVPSEPGNIWLDVQGLDTPRSLVLLSCR
jgi:hypothetical protein